MPEQPDLFRGQADIVGIDLAGLGDRGDGAGQVAGALLGDRQVAARCRVLGLKLGQALFSDTPVILLDEPCTNLDAEGIALYQRLILQQGAGRLVIVSSNDPQEYDFCARKIDIREYK